MDTISKLLKRLALTRFSQFITSSPNFNPLQSAYRKHYSTETCLLKTVSDFYDSIDKGASNLVVCLDLSAAFDTVRHDTLLNRLHRTFGISGSMLAWFDSYLADRKQFVSVSGCKSSSLPLAHGVPQGSVLGPLLFSIYTAPVSHLIASFGLRHQQYADDTLLYVALDHSNYTQAMVRLQECLNALRLWFAQNNLVINPEKSEASLFSTRQRLTQLHSLGLTSVSVAGHSIPITGKIKTLGVTLDSALTFRDHIRSVAQSSFFHIRAIKHIRHLISDTDANSLLPVLYSQNLTTPTHYCSKRHR